ncbi:S8 family peptidase [Streptomyces sp. NPDC050549]|uniref:S8 family peptidase n=1 Tax=Streptomyces sp. NPDC050549 TaxID=3155406 RepID=UPI0034250F71
MDAAAEELATQIQLSTSIQDADPQLVLVFEAIEEQIDLQKVAQRLGMEVLVETEDEADPDNEFVLKSARPRNPTVSSCLHAVCLNKRAFDQLLSKWRAWKRGEKLPRGYATLRDLFAHLKDVRPWGPQDRLKMVEWEDHFAGQITERLFEVELELWYRKSEGARSKAHSEVVSLVAQAGGEVKSSAVIDSIGYHGIKCSVPTEVLVDLANGRFDAVQLVKSANVMYFRVTGQAMPVAGQPVDSNVEAPTTVPSNLPPIVCLLDGVPAANHPLLKDRVMVHDPDDLTSGSTVEERKHGTWMSSTVIWGDLSAGRNALTRPVLVRPILAPSDETADRSEELPAGQLAPDLMLRAFRELFETHDGVGPVGSDIAIVNLSVGDPATLFDTIISSWARMLDWLSYHYGVLIVVSAGNHKRLPLGELNSDQLVQLRGEERRRAVLEAQKRDQFHRRIISPSESINAITVGAIHDDASGVDPVGYVADPADGLVSVSPFTAIGTGYRRSLKPELSTAGGRAFFRVPPQPSDEITFVGASSRGPGIKVAAPGAGQEVFIAGTSPACALVTREAARLYELVDEISDGRPLTRRQRAAAVKALLVHGTDPLQGVSPSDFPLERALGNGVRARAMADGCAANEAVLLFCGSIGAFEAQELTFPLPDGLSVREVKRIDATLAWLSPVNWRHRQYRKAALSFVKPNGDIPGLGTPVGLSTNSATRGAGTVQHLSWETQKAFAYGRGAGMSIRVKCLEQAGGLEGEKVPYAAVLSLWVAPSVGVDVYQQVREQLRSRVDVRA